MRINQKWFSEEAEDNVKFVLSVLQAIAIIFSAGFATYTYVKQSASQKEAIKRELRKPYDEKQLALYLEASRVTAYLASMEVERERGVTEAAKSDIVRARTRFWELYL